jgi:hypothetical protein
MATDLRRGLLAGMALVAAFGPPAGSSELLTMRVMNHAPATLVVHLSVEHGPDNRALVVTVESPDFYRSSRIQLDGDRSPRTSVFQLRGLPTDTYEVTGTLVGERGPKASVMRFVRVLSERPRSSRGR